MPATAIAVELVPREPPLEAVAAVALGAAARALGRRLLEEPDVQLAELRGLTGRLEVPGRGGGRAPMLAVLVGDSATALPWVDGIVYLGRDVEAPRLLLPTALRPAVSTALFEAAVLRRLAGPSSSSPSSRAPAPSPPFAVLAPSGLAGPRHVFSLASARPIERAQLERWLEAPA